jgi:hypothetical protein
MQADEALRQIAAMLSDCLRRKRKPTLDELMVMQMWALSGRGIDWARPSQEENHEQT